MNSLTIKSPVWAVYALTSQGADIALKIADGLKENGGAKVFLPKRLEKNNVQAHYFQTLKETLSANFNQFKGHLIVGAAGLVVRHISPLLKSKKDDPAVVVISQDGRWAISLLSGHLGGGNKLAEEAAKILGGQAVITTATDVENLPAIEMLAQEADLEVENFSQLPELSRFLVEGGNIKIYDPSCLLLPFLSPWQNRFEIIHSNFDIPIDEPSITVDHKLGYNLKTFILRPKILAVGIGCHQGLPPEEMEDFVKSKLNEAGFAEKSVSVLATVETRKTEPALLKLSKTFNRPLLIFSKAELEPVITPNPSAMVLKRIGVRSVCEAAAFLASGSEDLIISKQKGNGITLAAAYMSWYNQPNANT